MHLNKGFLLLLGSSLPQLASFGKSLLVRETLFLLQALSSGSVEVDIGTNSLGWLAALILGFLLNLG
jgi:hypothetical protein